MMVSPKIKASSPGPERKKPLKSNRATSRSRMLSMNLSDSARPSSPIGTLIQKIQRQFK